MVKNLDQHVCTYCGGAKCDCGLAIQCQRCWRCAEKDANDEYDVVDYDDDDDDPN